LYFFVIALAVLVCDQWIKYVIVSNMEHYQSIPVIKNIFHITYVQNKGAAFGLLPNQTLFFVIVTIIVVAVIITVFWKTRHRNNFGLLHLSLALQLGGALGNLIDRIRLGYVIDFLDFRIWPVFNFADSAIVVGVILLSWVLLRTPDDKTA